MKYSEMKYPVGTKIVCNDCIGIVIENYKLPGDVCVSWDIGLTSSYDEEWLDENVSIVND